MKVQLKTNLLSALLLLPWFVSDSQGCIPTHLTVTGISNSTDTICRFILPELVNISVSTHNDSCIWQNLTTNWQIYTLHIKTNFVIRDDYLWNSFTEYNGQYLNSNTSLKHQNVFAVKININVTFADKLYTGNFTGYFAVGCKDRDSATAEYDCKAWVFYKLERLGHFDIENITPCNVSKVTVPLSFAGNSEEENTEFWKSRFEIYHIPVDCGPLSHPAHGHYNSSGSTTYGHNVTYICNTGYELTGSQLRECAEDGNWTGTPAVCTIYVCWNLPDIAHGSVDYDGGREYGTSASYHCNHGYDLEPGDAKRVCQHGGLWNGTEPMCQLVDCGPLSHPAHGHYNSSGSTTYGHNVTYTCDTGYELTGSQLRECAGGGYWTGTPAVCTIYVCSNLPDIVHGSVDYDGGREYGTSASYHCNHGYDLEPGYAKRVCQHGGLWNGTEPVCHLVDCGPLSHPAHGHYNSSGSTTYGHNVTYTCDTGYELTGSQFRECAGDGNWTGTSAVCTIYVCSNLPDIAHGSVDYDGGREYGTSASYHCNHGYDLEAGYAKRVCQHGGLWNGTEPVCHLVDCGPLSHPAHGHYNSSGSTTYGHNVTYTCDTGYELTGSQFRECAGDGNWTGTSAVCTIYVCSNLPDIAHGSVDYDGGREYGTSASYHCNHGYDLEPGYAKRVCQHGGLWNGTEPMCHLVDCYELNNPENGLVDMSNGTTFNMTAEFNCYHGYRLEGAQFLTCQADGLWNGNMPICQLIGHPVLYEDQQPQQQSHFIEIKCDWNCEFKSLKKKVYLKVDCPDCPSSIYNTTWKTAQCATADSSTCGVMTQQSSSWTKETIGYEPEETEAGYYAAFVSVTFDDGTSSEAEFFWSYEVVTVTVGTCEIVPSSGYALDTTFNITCTDFLASSGSLVYEIYSNTKDNFINAMVLYKGPIPKLMDIRLGQGLESTNYTMYLLVNASTESSNDVTITKEVQVLPFEMKSEGTDIVNAVQDLIDVDNTGEGSEVDDMFNQGDQEEALQLLGMISSTLNTRTQSNETSYNTTQQAMVRTAVVNNVGKVNITDLNTVDLVVSVLNSAVEETGELTEEAQDKATDVYSDAASKLEELEASGNEVKTTAGSLMTGVATILDVKSDTGATQLDDNTTDPDNSVQMEKVKNSTSKILKTLDAVMSAMLSWAIPGEPPDIVQTETMAVAVQTISSIDLVGSELSTPGGTAEGMSACSMKFPSSFDEISGNDVGVKMMQLKKNPYTWDASARDVTLDVLSVDLVTSGSRVNASNLTEPFTISIPVNDEFEVKDVNISLHLVKSSSTITFNRAFANLLIFKFNVQPSKTTLLSILPDQSNFTRYKMLLTKDEQPSFDDIISSGFLFPDEIHLQSNFTSSQGGTEDIIFIEQPGNTTVTYYVGLTMALQDNDTLTSLQMVDPGCIGSENISDCQMSTVMSLQFETRSLACLYWDTDVEEWSNYGCQVSPNTSRSELLCSCTHLTTFTGSVLVLPNFVDPIADAALFLTFFDNPVVVTVVIMVWVVYFFLLTWSRKADRLDEEKVGVISCIGNDVSHRYKYLICVTTGWRAEAGTTANVYIYIKGSHGSSSRRRLGTLSRKCFQTGYEDWFVFTSENNIGKLREITLWHDNAGSSPHWYLSYVYIKDLVTDNFWTFIYNDWLAVDRGSIQMTSAAVTAISASQLITQSRHNFMARSIHDLRDGHLWISVFSKPVRSTFTRAQRLTCALSLLLLTMLTNIMFYGIPTDDPEDQVGMGDSVISLSAIVIGIESSLLMFPVNLIILQLFLKVKSRPVAGQIIEMSNQGKRSTSSSSIYPGQLIFKQLMKMLDIPVQPKVTEVTEKEDELNEKEGSQSSIQHLARSKIVKRLIKEWDIPVQSDITDGNEYEPSEMEECGKEDSQSSIQQLARSNIVKQLIKKWDIPVQPNSAEGTENEAEPGEKEEDEKGASQTSLHPAAQSNVVLAGESKNKGKILPWWFVYIAWTLVLCTCVVASFFVMLYGLKYGYTKSLQWLVSFLTGFTQSAFLTQPIKVFAIALVLTWIFKKTVDIGDNGPDVYIDDDEELMKNISGHPEIHVPYNIPLSSRIIQNIRDRLKLEWMMNMTIRDILLYLFYLSVVMVVTHGHRNIRHNYYNTLAIEDVFVNPGCINLNHCFFLDKVDTTGKIIQYLEEVLVPNLNDMSISDHAYATPGSSHFLVGPYRLRQQRVKIGSCAKDVSETIKPMFNNQLHQCMSEYWLGNEDTRNYDGTWAQILPDNIAQSSHWTHKSSWDLLTMPFSGQYATYSGGGYVLAMSGSEQDQLDTISAMWNSDWLDRRTRALFIEFTLFNPNVNIFSVVTIIFEKTNHGAVFPGHEVLSAQLYRPSSDFERFVQSCEVFFLLFNLAYMYFEYKKYKKLGRREYFHDFWNWVEILQISLAISAIGLYFKRMLTVKDIVSKYQESGGQYFVSFYTAVSWDYILGYIMAFQAAVVILKFIKLLRFNKNIFTVSDTLALSKKAIISFMIMILVFGMAFGHFTVLAFGTSMHSYRNMITSLITVFNFALGVSDLPGLQTTDRVLGPIYFVVFVVVVQFCFLTIFMAILNFGINEAKELYAERKNKFELLSYIKTKCRAILKSSF